MTQITLEDVSLTYEAGQGVLPALAGVSMNIRGGEFVSIIGPSGCGKSTLLSLFAGLNAPTGGCIYLNGQELRGTGPDRGVVFQHYSLFPWMSAIKNIIFGMRQVSRNHSKSQLQHIAEDYLAQVGLKEFADKYPSQLSGGMQQRVAIARAFAMDPSILLLDEPFGAVDAKNRVMLQDLLLKLWDSGQEKKTVVLVTHDVDEAILMSDRIIVMSAGPGTVKQELNVGFQRPRDRSRLIGSPPYLTIRNRLIGLFYDDVMKNIGGAEVVL